MTIQITPSPQPTDLRRAPRTPLSIKGSVRERGRSACEASIADLSIAGCRIESWGIPLAGNQVWIRLPGLESLPGQIIWASGSLAGISFDKPMHPAVFGRLAHPANDDRLVLQVSPESGGAPPLEPLLSRREQIIGGVVDCERSPLRRQRKPVRSGLTGMISRQVKRTADHRMEPRFSDFPGDGMPSVRIGSSEIKIRNLSQSGLRAQLVPPALATVTQQVTVQVTGFAPIQGRVIWACGDELGISLPPDSFELNYA